MMQTLTYWRFDCLALVAVSAALSVAYFRLAGAAFPRHVIRRSMIAAWVVVVLGCGTIEWAGAQQKMSIERILTGYAPSYAVMMEKSGIASLGLNTPAEDPTYLRLVELQKALLRVNPAVNDIYTFVRKDDGKIALLVDSETDYDRNGAYEGERESRTRIGEEYPDAAEAIFKAFEGSAVFDREPYSDRWGVWVSAYQPLHDGSGRQIGILGVDFDAKNWVSAIAKARLAMLLFWLVILTEFLMVGYFMARIKLDLLAREKLLHELRANRSQLEEISTQIPGAIVQFRMNQNGERELLFISQGISELTGLEPWEVKKLPGGIFDLVLPAFVDSLNKQLESAFNVRKDLVADFQIRGPKGSSQWVRLHISPKSLNEDDVNWTGTLTDISVAKADELDRTNRQKQIEHMNSLMVGRELKMIELKKRVRELEAGHNP